MVAQQRLHGTRILLIIATILMLAGTTVTPTYADPAHSTGTTGY